MLILTKAVLAIMLGFTISAIMGLMLVPLLKKIKVTQRVSVFLEKTHSKKNGIPTMGGFLFIVPTMLTLAFLVLTDKIEISYNLILVVFVFLSYGLIGFIDDLLIIKRKNNEGLTVFQKIVGQTIIAVIFYFIFQKAGNLPIVDFHTLGFKINMNGFYWIFVLLVLLATSNAVNVTDGLDGLAGSLSAVSFLSFGIISYGSTWITGNADIAIFCFILVGSLMGFLLFNSHPAKIFMGDTGSLALGGALGSIALITDHEITLFVVAGVFVIETLSVIIQKISVKFFNKKVFLMTPLHHHFEKLGWIESDIVKLFVTVGLILAMASITFGVWI